MCCGYYFEKNAAVWIVFEHIDGFVDLLFVFDGTACAFGVFAFRYEDGFEASDFEAKSSGTCIDWGQRSFVFSYGRVSEFTDDSIV